MDNKKKTKEQIRNNAFATEVIRRRIGFVAKSRRQDYLICILINFKNQLIGMYFVLPLKGELHLS